MAASGSRAPLPKQKQLQSTLSSALCLVKRPKVPARVPYIDGSGNSRIAEVNEDTCVMGIECGHDVGALRSILRSLLLSNEDAVSLDLQRNGDVFIVAWEANRRRVTLATISRGSLVTCQRGRFPRLQAANKGVLMRSIEQLRKDQQGVLFLLSNNDGWLHLAVCSKLGDVVRASSIRSAAPIEVPDWQRTLSLRQAPILLPRKRFLLQFSNNPSEADGVCGVDLSRRVRFTVLGAQLSVSVITHDFASAPATYKVPAGTEECTVDIALDLLQPVLTVPPAVDIFEITLPLDAEDCVKIDYRNTLGGVTSTAIRRLPVRQ